MCILMVFVLTFAQRQDVVAKSKMKAPKIKSYKEVFKKNWDNSYITVKWKKIKNADGYQVCLHTLDLDSGEWYQNKSSMKNTYFGCEWPNVTEKLKIRVRAYKVVDDKKVYGAWSKKVNIKQAIGKKPPFSKVTKIK